MQSNLAIFEKFLLQIFIEEMEKNYELKPAEIIKKIEFRKNYVYNFLSNCKAILQLH